MDQFQILIENQIEKQIDLNDDYFIKVQQIKEFRENGKQAYSQKQYSIALQFYQDGLDLINSWPDEEFCELKQEQNLIFTGNKTQCLIQQQLYIKAIEILNNLLNQSRDTKYEVKNYYRIVQCFVGLGQYDLVEQYIKKVKQLCYLNKWEIEQFNRCYQTHAKELS